MKNRLLFSGILALLAPAAAFADATGGAPAFVQLMPMVFAFVVLFFLVLRPQMKKQKEQQAFISNLKRGDKVITAGGILGTIEGIAEQFVTVEIANDVRIKVVKAQVSAYREGSTQSLGAKGEAKK